MKRKKRVVFHSGRACAHMTQRHISSQPCYQDCSASAGGSWKSSQFPFVFPEYRLGLANVDLFIRGHNTRIPPMANEKGKVYFNLAPMGRYSVQQIRFVLLILLANYSEVFSQSAQNIYILVRFGSILKEFKGIFFGRVCLFSRNKAIIVNVQVTHMLTC